MQLSSRFSISLHMLVAMEVFKDEKVTSSCLANSIGVNPVVIRRILSQLKEAGIVEVKRGSGGAKIVKPLTEVNLLDVYRAVEVSPNALLFNFHDNPNPDCPVGKNIHSILDHRLVEAQNALESQLKDQTLADVMTEAYEKIN
ncbi:Rrf2 family transcriptional regulator [Ligilactobacillus apodemi]|nr:Rrf2 family transcriptional regulator [Ligilactobacillus apodemi]